MANEKVSVRTAMLATETADADSFPITDADAGTSGSKRIVKSELVKAMNIREICANTVMAMIWEISQ